MARKTIRLTIEEVDRIQYALLGVQPSIAELARTTDDLTKHRIYQARSTNADNAWELLQARANGREPAYQ